MDHERDHANRADPDRARLRLGASAAVAFMEANPTSAFARGIEAIAAKLPAAPGPGGRVFMLAPLVEGEGCSTLTRCLAVALGTVGRRVLLIDADGVRRTLSAGLSLSSRPGLGDVLQARVAIATAVVPQPHFAFLPVGQAAFDPAEARAARHLGAVLAEARGRFDVVLIDGPACHGQSTPSDWAAHVDGFAMVACWDQMLEPAFLGTIDAVTQMPRFAGLVLNRTTPREQGETDFALAS